MEMNMKELEPDTLEPDTLEPDTLEPDTLEPTDFLKMIMKDEQVDIKTKKFLGLIKNPIFMENIYDTEKKQIVNSLYLNKITKMGRQMSTMVWQYYRHRGKLNVNKVIKQYGRENLTINYKIFQ